MNLKHLPTQVDKVWSPFSYETDIPILYGRDLWQVDERTIRCGLDLFASAFYMLTRWEEHVKGERDFHHRFPGSASAAYEFEFLLRPVVNEYVEMLWNMLKHLGMDQTRIKKRFNWTITHDVDYPYRWDVAKRFQGDCKEEFGLWDSVSSFFSDESGWSKGSF